MSGSEERLQRTMVDLLNDEDEDDDIYEPATDGNQVTTDASISTSMDSGEIDDEAETDGDEFADAHESFPAGGIEIVFENGPADEDEDDGEQTEIEANAAGGSEGTTRDPRDPRHQRILEQIQALLNGREGLQRLLQQGNYRIITYGGSNLYTARADPDDDDDDDDDDDSDDSYYPHRLGYRRRRHRRRHPLDPNRFPKIPNPAGRDLQASGVFGQTDSRVEKMISRKATLSQRLLWRRLGIEPRSTAARHNRLISQEMIPNTTQADSIIHYDSRAYSGQFSDDGNFFFSCTQNFKVQMYDTSNPYEWRYYKSVDFPFGQWTITDATLSPDNRFLAYSSIRHTICLAPTDPGVNDGDRESHTLLDFTNYAPGAIMGNTRHAAYMGRQGFGIWSLRFSGDGREVVAGTSDHSVLVYDLERRQTTLKLRKHGDDVNAVCFGDKSSPHILFSGSDDQTLRVWDRRSMADGREAGVFVGHTEGLTYVDSKGDGRYVLSNGKDQMMKLWDLRKMVSPGKFDEMNISRYTTNFDYRFAEYNMRDWEPNPDDCSVVTYRGHSVLKTLIRCHFSPPGSSNSRYVYSGSEDGKVYIWNLDGTQKATIDVSNATRETRPRLSNGGNEWDWDMGYNSNVWKTCVRDASWSPSVPVIAATSWNGWGMSTGTVSVHSWNDSTFVPARLSCNSSPLSAKQKAVGAVDGTWVDNEDEGEPEMGQSYNERLRPLGTKTARQGTRGWGRASGRGLRSNPVQRQRYGMGEEEGAGW